MSGRHHSHVGLLRTRTTALRRVIGLVTFSVGLVVDDFAVELAQLFLRRLQSRSLTVEKFDQVIERSHGRLERRGGEVLTGVRCLLERLRNGCLLYTSDAADERSSVDLGGRR